MVLHKRPKAGVGATVTPEQNQRLIRQLFRTSKLYTCPYCRPTKNTNRVRDHRLRFRIQMTRAMADPAARVSTSVTGSKPDGITGVSPGCSGTSSVFPSE